MFSNDILFNKKPSRRISYLYIFSNLLIVFIAFCGCSKSPEELFVALSKQELNDINYKLQDYMFMTNYFDDKDRLWDFLQKAASLHYDSYPLVASGGTLWSVKENDISSWLRGKEKSEKVFRKLCPDPKLTLDSNKWDVVFNVFRKDGGVDKWQVTGEHYPAKRYNQINKIKISNLKPEGTFFCPLMG